VRDSCAAAEIAQLPVVVNSKQNVLRLDVAMGDWRLLQVHVAEACYDVGHYQEDFALRKTFRTLVCARLDQIEQVTSYRKANRRRQLKNYTYLDRARRGGRPLCHRDCPL